MQSPKGAFKKQKYLHLIGSCFPQVQRKAVCFIFQEHVYWNIIIYSFNSMQNNSSRIVSAQDIVDRLSPKSHV